MSPGGITTYAIKATRGASGHLFDTNSKAARNIATSMQALRVGRTLKSRTAGASKQHTDITISVACQSTAQHVRRRFTLRHSNNERFAIEQERRQRGCIACFNFASLAMQVDSAFFDTAANRGSSLVPNPCSFVT